jgi:predicted AAA+ superfamily ATPase
LNAATPGEPDKPAKTTTMAYRDVLASLWLLDPIPAWIPGRNHLDRLGQAPKHMLADPALAARLLGLDASALLRGEQGNRQLVQGSILGGLFEHLVALSVLTYADAAQARVSHMRIHDGAQEVDLIIARPDGRVLAVEVKLANRVDDADVLHLHWLREKIGADLIDTAVVNTGPDAYRRRDGVAVIPLALLGP